MERYWPRAWTRVKVASRLVHFLGGLAHDKVSLCIVFSSISYVLCHGIPNDYVPTSLCRTSSRARFGIAASTRARMHFIVRGHRDPHARADFETGQAWANNAQQPEVSPATRLPLSSALLAAKALVSEQYVEPVQKTTVCHAAQPGSFRSVVPHVTQLHTPRWPCGLTGGQLSDPRESLSARAHATSAPAWQTAEGRESRRTGRPCAVKTGQAVVTNSRVKARRVESRRTERPTPAALRSHALKAAPAPEARLYALAKLTEPFACAL